MLCFLKVLLLVHRKVRLCLLPDVLRPLPGLLPRPGVCLGPRAFLWVSQPPSSPSMYPVPPDPACSPGARLCGQIPQGRGGQFNTLRGTTNCSPSAPGGKGRGPSSLANKTMRFALFATLHPTSSLSPI